MMKLFNDLKQFVILGMCALCLVATPLMTSAHAATQNSAQTQRIDNSTSDGTDTTKSDNPPKPPPKPGPRDGGADD